VIRTGPPACGEADKAAVTAFKVNPDRPLVGRNITATLTLKSKCPAGTADLNVPWEIIQNNAKVGGGSVTLAPGAAKDVSATVTATPGTHNFYGSLKLNDGGSNNTSDDAPPVVVLKEVSLSHAAVQGAGEQFANNVEPGPPPNCVRLGVVNADNDQLPLNQRMGVVFVADCQLTGGKANPEAFKNLRLKPGWVVASAAIEERLHEDPRNAGFNQLTMPTPGGTNPHVRFHVWANARSKIYLRVLVVIRGPAADSSPFQ
jgi:hypothetical protein